MPALSPKEREERRLERRMNRPKIVPDRRRHGRAPVSVFGRFMREDKQEYPCQVVNMSAGGMAMIAPVSVKDGERIVAYLDNLGRIEGIVVRSFEGGFAVRILASLYKRERIANLLTWLINQKSLGLGEERKHERIVPRINASKLIMPNGDVHNCRVIDVSLSGASVACTVKPPLGTMVILGRMRGRVVRHHELGIALQFIELQDPDSLARTFG
jgi:PilZ domain